MRKNLLRDSAHSRLVALISLLAITAAIMLACGESSAASGTPTSNASSQTTKATATPTHTAKWTTVQSFQGNGTKKTATFSVPNDWKIVWSCDPNSFYGGQYNVIVSVDDSSGNPVDYGAVNTICKAGNTGDTTEEHQGGNVYLDVNSEGAWTIQVQVLK